MKVKYWPNISNKNLAHVQYKLRYAVIINYVPDPKYFMKKECKICH